MKLYSKVMAALLAASLAAQLMVPAYAYNVSSDTTSTGGQVVINNQDGTQQVLTQEDLENGADLPEGIVIENGENTQAPATPAPQVSQAPAQESEAPAQESEDPAQETPAPTQSGGDTNSDRIDMNLPVVSPSTGNSSDGSATQQETPLAVYWNPGSGYELDESKLSVAFQGQQSQKSVFQQGLSWLSNLVSGVFGGGSKTVQVPAGKDSNSGRSPMAPVKTFEAAVEQAQALADEQGVDVQDVTIYSMNPQEVLEGENLDISAANLTVQAWEGRNYDSDVLFYVNDGTLTLEKVTLSARDEENEEKSAQTLVQVFDGSVAMGASVTVNGGFVLDFRPSEAEKMWDTDGVLTDEKAGNPVIELSQDFQPDSNGYFITVLSQAEDERLEVVRTSGMTQAQVQSYAGSFMLTGVDSQEWSLEVDKQDQTRSATTMARSAAPASLSLYAVRDANSVIYWNPGGEFTFNEKTYPAGSDTGRDGLTPSYPLKTFAAALQAAQKNSTRNIVCMQTITVNDSTFASISEYLTVEGTTIKLHGDQTSGDPILLTNWDQGLPIIDIEGNYTLSMENVQLKGYGSDTTQRAANLVSVGKGTNVIMGASATVTVGAYIQMDFSKGAPNPIQVNSQDAAATIFASGVMYAPHFDGTKLVQATETLVNDLGGKDAAGKHLLEKFALSTLNTSPSPSGGDKPVVWSLVQNTTPGEENSLVLKAAKTYETIYIDPERGNDSYDGLTCQFPVATMDRALKVLQEGIEKVLLLRQQAHDQQMSDEQIDLLYPLPGRLAACSTIEITDAKTWDWSSYQEKDPVTGTVVKPYLTAHEEGGLGADGEPTHQAPQYVIRVTGSNASLTLKDVEISRTLSTVGEASQWNLINVLNGGQLTLDGATELFTQAQNQSQGIPAYMGVGIVAGWNEPTSFTSGSMSVSESSAATITLQEGWTGKIHGLSRGVLLIGKQASMTMNGGAITDNRNRWAGAGVSAFQGAKFTMDGGTISNNQAAIGAGVLVSSKYSVDGLGADDSSKFTMIQGTIQGNTIDLDVDALQGYDGMGGAGILSYYAVVELGQGQGQKNACRIEGNSLSRDMYWNWAWSTCTGVGVSIYGQNTWDEKALIVNGATVTGNMVDDGAVNNYQKSLNVRGIGLGLSEVKSVQVENADITNNNVKAYYRGTTARSLVGGGLYVSGSSDATSLIFRNLTVTGNQLDGTKFSQTGSSTATAGGGICFETIPDTAITLLEDSTVANNAVGLGYSSSASGGGIRSDALLRLNRVTVSGNRAGDETNGGGSGGGIYGSILWANEMMLKDNVAGYSGGGWYNVMSNGRTSLSTVIQDSEIMGNRTAQTGISQGDGDGGGIMFKGTGRNYSCTLTETQSGKTKITGNHAAGSGGGVYLIASGITIFDFASEWNNTAGAEAANLWSDAMPSWSSAVTHILKGKFVGSESIYVLGESGRKDLHIDLNQVTFAADKPDDPVIYLSDPGSVVSLLTKGDAGHPLHVRLNSEKFGAGSVVVRPANLSKVAVGTLTTGTLQSGGYEVGSTDRSYTAFSDISQGGTTHLTAEGLPLRTQLMPMQDKTLISLGIVAEGVYLDGTKGDDTKDGLSSQNAVKTWSKAVELLQQYSDTPPTDAQKTTGFQPVIWVCGTVTPGFRETITLPQSIVSETYKRYEEGAKRTPERAVVKRFGTFQDGPMFRIYAQEIKMEYVRIDGNSGAIASPGMNCDSIRIEGGYYLTIGDGARIYNSSRASVHVYQGGLNVTQSFTPDQTDPIDDEKYGIQIESEAVKGNGSSKNAIRIGYGATVNLNGYAYIGGVVSRVHESGYAIEMYGGQSKLNINDNALVQETVPIYFADTGTITMNGNAKIEAGVWVFHNAFVKSGANIVMNGNSTIAAAEGTSGALYVADAVNYSITMKDSSKLECAIRTAIRPSNSDTGNSGLKIVMGTAGGSDSPQIVVPNNPSSTYPGSILVGGGHLYLEMNANSSVTGGVSFIGMYPASQTLQYSIPKFGLVMRDNARLQSGDGSKAAVNLASGYFAVGDVAGTYLWNGTVPFAIEVEDNAVIDGGIWSKLTFDKNNPDKVMGYDQTITLRDSAQVQGIIGDKNDTIGISSVVLEGNTSVQAKDGMTAQDKLVTARRVTLKGDSTISASSSTDADTAVFGQGVSIYVLESLNLDGTATVDGPIQLAQNANITLMSPVPDTAQEGCFKLHLAAYHMGEVVVKPDGTTVTDARTYLPYFVKAAAQGEASQVSLVGDDDVNIILNRLWNVYLSTNGSDTNNGASADSAVRTFAKARELLKKEKGYGPGSNIIIADSVLVQAGDLDWSFDEGGTVTNEVSKQTWTPLVTRSTTSVYNKPMIMITQDSIPWDNPAQQIVFRNITLDAGGKNVKFALSNTEGGQTYQNSLLYISGLYNRKGSSVLLGEGAVLQNLEYDMAQSGTGETQLGNGQVLGGYAVHVDNGHLVMDGCTVQNFKIQNIHYEYATTQTQSNTTASIVYVTGAWSNLEFKSGSICNNSIDVDKFQAYNSNAGVGILVVNDGTNFTMSGGQIYKNVLSGVAEEIYYPDSVQRTLPTGILALSSGNNSGGTKTVMSGGSVHDNENKIKAIDESSDARYTEGIICLGSTFDAYMNSGHTFKMTGGSITNNVSRRGSAIAVMQAVVTLAGGTIRDNRSVVEAESADWKAEYSPIFIGGEMEYTEIQGNQQLVLQGSNCMLDDSIFLARSRQITLSDRIRDTQRVYQVYMDDPRLTQGSAVVIPDNNTVTDVTPYLQNFRVYAKGMVLDRGRVNQDIGTGVWNSSAWKYETRNELYCLVLMKAVFVDGDSGHDPEEIAMHKPLSGDQKDLGRTPGNPVKTLDAARAIGESACYLATTDEGYTDYESSQDHEKHKDHYVIYAVGPVYNELFTGNVTNNNVGYTKNDSLNDFQFTLGGASYLTRYTGWKVYTVDGQFVSGDYYYGNLIQVKEAGTATLRDITVQGRREIDSVANNGETLVVVNQGATLTIADGTNLQRNNASGSRPKPNDSGQTQPIDSRGGAIRAEAGAKLIMTGGVIDSTCTALYGGSIYLEGAENGQNTAQLTMQNTVKVGSEIYLGGQQKQDYPIWVDSSFQPDGSISIGLQSDYDGKPVVQWTDNTPVTEEMMAKFTYSSSVTALYKTKAISSTGTGQPDTIALDLRKILYLDPVDGRAEYDGSRPDKAVNSIEQIYTMLQDVPEEDIPGVLVFVMNPITVGSNEQLVISNGQLKENGVTKHISVFSQGEASTTFDSNIGIVHGTTEKVIPCELYFRRYVETSDKPTPEGYNRESNLKELFVVEGGGQLQLNGMYLDGQSLGIQTTGNPGLSSNGVVAQAPLVQVKAGGSAQFLTGVLEGTGNYQASSSMLTNNTNNYSKTTPLPGTDGITEGSSAGIEILSSGTEQGWGTEKRGKVVLQNTKLDNLKLDADQSGKAVIGGSDIYQNGELWISDNTRFGGSVFLEGNGKSGEDETAKQSRQTSRWINVRTYGKPVETTFMVSVRDPYQNRRMVMYPYSSDNDITQEEISFYMLTEEASRHYILVKEKLDPNTGENFMGGGENTLWLRVPPAVYIDPVNGSDEKGDGLYPDTAVQTLPKAVELMTGLSSKVLYVLNPIPITGNSYLYPTGYTYDGTVKPLPSQNLQLDIRRYVKPDAPTTQGHYQTASYTDGALFDIQSGGSLTLEGSVILDGASQPLVGPEVPADYAYSKGVQVSAPLVTVDQGGTLELRSAGQGEEVTRPTLTNNDNTGALGEGEQREEGGAVYNAGSVILNGGMLVNNKAESVTGTDGMKGMADGIYQAGELTIRSYPQGLKDQSVYLAGNRMITVDVSIQDMEAAAGEISLDMDNAVAGRDVVMYTNATNVDAESARYSLGNSVPGSLFLVQSESASNVLELQDWKQLNVSVPEEVFLVVYQGGTSGAQIGDVDSYPYGAPEYTITNNGTRDVRVSVNGFNVAAVRDKGNITLVDSTADLSGAEALLYLALTKSRETAEEGNSFTQLTESSLTMPTGENIELGTLGQGKHGSFAFTGSANQAFLDQWLDSNFPADAAARKDYMRTKDPVTGETSLKNAAAQFKLTYRIELA